MGQSDDFFCFSGLEEAKPTSSTFQVRNYPGLPYWPRRIKTREESEIQAVPIKLSGVPSSDLSSTAAFLTYPTEDWVNLARSAEVSAVAVPNSSGGVPGRPTTAETQAPAWPSPSSSPPEDHSHLASAFRAASSMRTDGESGKPGC